MVTSIAIQSTILDILQGGGFFCPQMFMMLFPFVHHNDYGQYVTEETVRRSVTMTSRDEGSGSLSRDRGWPSTMFNSYRV